MQQQASNRSDGSTTDYNLMINQVEARKSILSCRDDRRFYERREENYITI